MFKRNKIEKLLLENIDKLNKSLQRNNFLDLVELLGDRKKLFIRNFSSGIFKGIGIGIGVTLITAILLILLQKIVALNIPVIGEFIADIVDIVQNNR
ncbi:putative uncharacterized protein [Clostridium sp. CAG:273]|jgi:hypothetical protein|nr:DUF5665 domain-containing protein [Clostridia bacterium]CDE84424.1 putative uncharacterized protein [Clostridium sp. CAG:273]